MMNWKEEIMVYFIKSLGSSWRNVSVPMFELETSRIGPQNKNVTQRVATFVL